MKMLTNAPEISTERLVLRGPAQEDLEDFTRFLTSAPSMKAMNETGSRDDAWFGFMVGIGHWHWHGFGFFTLVEPHSGKPVGRVGLLKHLSWADVELAWHLYEGAEGKGYATEAAFAVKKWAADEFGFHSLKSYIDVENTRSQRVALRLGATRDGTRAAHEENAEVWSHC